MLSPCRQCSKLLTAQAQHNSSSTIHYNPLHNQVRCCVNCVTRIHSGRRASHCHICSMGLCSTTVSYFLTVITPYNQPAYLFCLSWVGACCQKLHLSIQLQSFAWQLRSVLRCCRLLLLPLLLAWLQHLCSLLLASWGCLVLDQLVHTISTAGPHPAR